MKYFPQLHAAYNSVVWNAWTSYHKPDGEMIVPPFRINPESAGRALRRSDMAKVLTDEVHRRGIEIRYNSKVIEYFETPENGGIVLDGGERLTADVVVAADGLHSRSWALVTGKKEEPASSGNAVYRACYPLDRALADPVFREYYEEENVEGRHRMRFVVGPDFHGITMFGPGARVVWYNLSFSPGRLRSEFQT